MYEKTVNDSKTYLPILIQFKDIVFNWIHWYVLEKSEDTKNLSALGAGLTKKFNILSNWNQRNVNSR
uniref:Uncharacterized protein n=1 Tax=Romanomermis culicivorax TaxID=13658 RepID=A0A915JS90_ROMCU